MNPILNTLYSCIDLNAYKINPNLALHFQCDICYSQDKYFIDALSGNFNGKPLHEILDCFPIIKEFRLLGKVFNMCTVCFKQFIGSYLFLEKLKESNRQFRGLVKFSANTTFLYQNQAVGETERTIKNISKEESDKQLLTNKDKKNHVISNGSVIHDHSYIENNDTKKLEESEKMKIVINHDGDTIKTEEPEQIKIVVAHNEDIIKTKEPEQIKIVVGHDVDTIQTQEPEQIKIEVDLNEDTEKLFICEACGSGFNKRQNYEYHKRRVHLRERNFKCEFCEKAFFLKHDYQRHLLLHIGGTPYKCSKCEKAFSAQLLLKNHINTVHLERNIKCTLCPKMFKMTYQLRRHMVVHGMDHYPFHKDKNRSKEQCEVCGIKVWRGNFKAHMTTHSDVKQFQCDVCGMEFKQICSLKNHKLIHAEPKFSCEHCGKAFFTNSSMKLHIRRHHTKEIVCTCQDCGKGFVHIGNLHQHRKNCHDDKKRALARPRQPCQCPVCGKIYSCRTSLVHHRRREHENRIHRCNKCNMSFKYYSSIRTHMKKIHNITKTQQDPPVTKKSGNLMYLTCTLCGIRYKAKYDLANHIATEHQENLIENFTLYECSICPTFFDNVDIFQQHFGGHINKDSDQIGTTEYELGGINVKCYQIIGRMNKQDKSEDDQKSLIDTSDNIGF